MKFKKISAEEALGILKKGEYVCIVEKVYLEDDPTVTDLLTNELVVEISEETAEQPPNESGGKAPARKKIDWGKVKALADAGWSAEKIADEMGTTVGTIYTGLSKRRKEHGKAETKEAYSGAEEEDQ